MGRRETILEEAQRLVFGDRGRRYGHPREDFRRTAEIWTALLGRKLTSPVEPHEVALCMIGLKLSREVHAHGRDSVVDLAGYAETLARVHGDDA